MESINEAQKELLELVALLRKLRAPGGCPWDRKQTPRDIGRYLLDEAYEVCDALAGTDALHVREELGDLLFQILFIAEIASEAGQYTLVDVLREIKEKMIRRHPHVFGDVRVGSAGEVKSLWQEIKKRERADKGRDENPFVNIPRALPALKRAQKITAAASVLGFDWPDAESVRLKLKEELGELDRALKDANARKIEEETGDILFTLVNLSRFMNVDAEDALTGCVEKFLRRFSYIASELQARGRTPHQSSLAEMDALWDEAKEKGI